MVYTLSLESTSWLATLTGESTLTVYTNDSIPEMHTGTLAGGDAAQFSGFLFKVNGGLVLFADVLAGGPGHASGPN